MDLIYFMYMNVNKLRIVKLKVILLMNVKNVKINMLFQNKINLKKLNVYLVVIRQKIA